MVLNHPGLHCWAQGKLEGKLQWPSLAIGTITPLDVLSADVSDVQSTFSLEAERLLYPALANGSFDRFSVLSLRSPDAACLIRLPVGIREFVADITVSASYLASQARQRILWWSGGTGPLLSGK